jgi:uncharacterized membrane protein YhaH (DUF805 family)
MLGYLDFLYFSYSGRIGRLAFWVGSLALFVIELAAALLLLKLSGGTLADLKAGADTSDDVLLHVVLPQFIIGVIFLFPTYALCTKRWHDRGKSGWWSLISLVPLIGGVWMLIELWFLGSDDDNRFGEMAY